MTWHERFQHVIKTLRPWPSRGERHAAIQSATAEKQRAIRGRDQARSIEDQINRIAAANHWAKLVADGLGIHTGDRNGDK